MKERAPLLEAGPTARRAVPRAPSNLISSRRSPYQKSIRLVSSQTRVGEITSAWKG